VIAPVARGITHAGMLWIGAISEIEDQQDMQGALDRSHRETAELVTLLETLHANAPIGFGFVDRELRIVRINDALAAVNGATVEAHLGRLVSDVTADIWPQVEPIYRQVLETGQPVINREVSGPSAAESGRQHHWLASYYPVPLGSDIIGVGVVVVDISEIKEAEEFRAVVMDNMAEGLFALDAEGLLTYMNGAASDSLGWTERELCGQPMHETIHFQRADGTQLPVEECPLLQVRSEGRTVRITDDAFTRKDGTIFPVAYSSAPLRSGATIHGVVVVFRDITEEARERAGVRKELAALSWIGRIRDAIDEHRLVLFSQPIVPLAGGRPSEELLLRMIGRDGEIILPGSFLPVAEQYGLVGEIDRWVITQAVRLAARGRRVIEANLSAASVGGSGLLPFIDRQLREAGADPANLVFEITETALMRNVTAGDAFARGLAELGCGLALDDFGTGFGGFTYLKKLPITYLKIDIEFVRDLVTNRESLHVVKAIVSLARAFGLRTIAEGVEDEETLAMLRTEGVDFGQGFHLGRPAPISQADA
jgi:PAS domain S-box-containing protein